MRQGKRPQLEVFLIEKEILLWGWFDDVGVFDKNGNGAMVDRRWSSG